MKTNLDTINRNIFKPEWTNHVYLSSFYKIQDIYCAELVISSTVVLKHSVKEYDLKNLFKSNELLIKSGMTVSQMEKVLILETLKANGNNKTKAADMLGISIRTLRNKINEYNLC